jgi:glycosyltransferase involved in cell wall biosynthesis
MKVSLIVATVGRMSELHRLLTSLDAQVYKNFELIVVDQNLDDRLENVIASFYDRLTIIHQDVATWCFASSQCGN